MLSPNRFNYNKEKVFANINLFLGNCFCMGEASEGGNTNVEN